MEENKIKEDLEINIKESSKVEVKDIEFSLNTMMSGMASFVTEKINGVLEGIMVDSKNQIQLKITLANSDILLFDIVSIQGIQFIPLRLGVVSSLGENFRDGYTKWVLNDKLRFEIKGAINSEAKFLVRYC